MNKAIKELIKIKRITPQQLAEIIEAYELFYEVREFKEQTTLTFEEYFEINSEEVLKYPTLTPSEIAPIMEKLQEDLKIKYKKG